MWQIVKTGSSYASQSELPLTFGLGERGWRSRACGSAGPADASTRSARSWRNQVVTIHEGAGVVSRPPRSGARHRGGQ